MTDVLVVLLFFGAPAMAVLAAILGGRALMEPAPDYKRLRLAGALVAAPWIILLLVGGEYAPQFFESVVKGHPMILSPIVGLGLAIGAWLRRPRRPAPRVEAPKPVSPPIGAGRRIALLAELRLPDLKPSAVALAVMLPIMWWIGAESDRSGGHSNPIGGLAGQILVSVGTLGVTALAAVLALAFIIRPAAAVAATYAWLALAGGAGITVLWIVGYWEEAAGRPYLHYAWASAQAWIGMAALTPALAGQALHLIRQQQGAASAPYPTTDTGQPIPLSDRARFVWLVLVPALPALVAAAFAVVVGILDRLDLRGLGFARAAWYDTIAGFAFLWTSIGPAVIAVTAAIGWLAVRHSALEYRRWWKYVTIACGGGWLLLWLIMP